MYAVTAMIGERLFHGIVYFQASAKITLLLKRNQPENGGARMFDCKQEISGSGLVKKNLVPDKDY